MSQTLTEFLWEIHWREKKKRRGGKKKRPKKNQPYTMEASLLNPYTTFCADIINTLLVA